MSRILFILVLALIGVAGVFGGRWDMYVTNTETPYEEVGIALNGYMPEPVRAWGCAKLHVTFPKSVPPLGCAKPSGTGREWMS